MPIGHFFARSIDDASQILILLDGFVILIGIYNLMQSNENQAAREEAQWRSLVQTWGAVIGLPGAVLAKSADKSSPVSAASAFAMASALIFAYSATAEWAQSQKLTEEADLGTVVLSDWYWAAEAIAYFFIVIMAGNHFLLSVFLYRRLKWLKGGNRPVFQDEPGYNDNI